MDKKLLLLLLSLITLSACSLTDKERETTASTSATLASSSSSVETAIIEVIPFEKDIFRIINHSDDNYEIETVEVEIKENGSWQQLPNSSFEFIDSYEDYTKPVDENEEMETNNLMVWERYVEAHTDDIYHLETELTPDKDYRITTYFAVRLPNSDGNTIEREMVVTEVSGK